MNVWLMGGFGNVLFQILAYRVLIDQGHKSKYITFLTERNMLTKLMRWNIHQVLYKDLIHEAEIRKIALFHAIVIVVMGYFTKVVYQKVKIATFYNDTNKFEKPYAYNIFGYFQEIPFLTKNQKLLKQLGEDLRHLYAIPSEITVVHYRRGDSEWAKKHENYYVQVRNMVHKELSDIIIVTDSLDAATVFFGNYAHIKIISSNNALDDFKIMVSAKKLYCAPSTFSWWAAHALEDKTEVIIPSFFRENLGIYREQNCIVVEC